jgi:riboflavin kinase
MRAGKITLLTSIAKRGGLLTDARITSGSLAAQLGVSQQTASRWLAELASEGLVEKRFGRASLAEKGRQYLKGVAEEIDGIFSESQSRLRLLGRVVSGMAEGRFYLSIPEYKRQMADALGIGVFPGTLNLRLEGAASINGKRRLMAAAGLEIAGFRKNGRVLGGQSSSGQG